MTTGHVIAIAFIAVMLVIIEWVVFIYNKEVQIWDEEMLDHQGEVEEIDWNDHNN